MRAGPDVGALVGAMVVEDGSAVPVVWVHVTAVTDARTPTTATSRSRAVVRREGDIGSVSSTLASGAVDQVVMLGERRVPAVRTILPEGQDQLVHVGWLREVERAGQGVGLRVAFRERSEPVDLLDEPQHG